MPEEGPGRDQSEGQRPGMHMAQLCRAEGKAANDTRQASKAWSLGEPSARMVARPPEDGGQQAGFSSTARGQWVTEQRGRGPKEPCLGFYGASPGGLTTRGGGGNEKRGH